jgi:hypothetical protein
MLTLIATLGLTAALTSTTAFAQMPDMDMSWAMRSQMQLQQQGDATARATAMAYYRYMLQLRRMGYTGPSLPTGVTPETLRLPRSGCSSQWMPTTHRPRPIPGPATPSNTGTIESLADASW